MKMRSDCVLSVLTTDQLNEIFDSLVSGTSFRAMQHRCSLPPPEGFGIRVQLPTLHRFYKAERRRRHAEELAETKFNDLAGSDPEQLYENVRVELAHACYDLVNHSDTPNVNVLARITHRLDLIRLEQQRLALEREFLAEKKRQFNFNAAREAAKHAHKIKDVIKTRGIDAEDKLWKVSDIVFGPPPTKPLDQNSTSQPTAQNAATEP